MIVFRNYFKIIKKFLPIIIIYTTIFMFFAVMTTSFNSSTQFTVTKPNIGIVNNDSSLITETFIKYVESNAVIIDINNDENSLKDALFYRVVDYILIIPENYGISLLTDLSLKIETMKVPDSYSSTYTEMLLNRFLNISNTYAKSGLDEATISSLILNDLESNTTVTTIESNNSNLEKINYFYNFANYTILAVSILIVGMIINIYNNKNIKKRNLVSSISYKQINRELFLGNACLTTLIWAIYVLISLILYKETMFTYNGLLVIINSFLFSITALSIGTVVGNLVTSREAQNGIVNVIALGSSFLCGAFVPQQYLGETVLNIGKVFPSFWYIKNNNDIMLLSIFNFETLKPILINMVILIIYSILLFIITNIISKSRLKKS